MKRWDGDELKSKQAIFFEMEMEMRWDKQKQREVRDEIEMKSEKTEMKTEMKKRWFEIIKSELSQFCVGKYKYLV